MFSDHHLGPISSEGVFVKATVGVGVVVVVVMVDGGRGRILLSVSLSCNKYFVIATFCVCAFRLLTAVTGLSQFKVTIYLEPL